MHSGMRGGMRGGMRRGVLLALLLGSVNACADEPAVTPPRPPDVSPTATGCQSEPAQAPTLTAPGTVLCLGGTAVLPVLDVRERRAVVEVAVTAFGEVSEAEVARLAATVSPEDFDPEATTVFTVTARAGLVSAPAARGPEGIEPLGLAGLVSEDDSAAINLVSAWNPVGCAARFFASTDAPGTQLTTCIWFTVDRGDEVSAVRVGSDVPAYDPLAGRPVVWR